MKFKNLLPVFAIASTITLASCGDKTPAVDPAVLAGYRNTMIETLAEYSDTNVYREAETNLILKTIEDTTKAINKAKSLEAIDKLVANAISTITSLKTDEEYVATEVPSYDNSVSTALSREYAKLGYKSIYQDINFREPLLISKPLQNEEEFYYFNDRIDVHNKGHEGYKWEVAQWSTNYDLIGNGEETSGYEVVEDPTNPLIHTIRSKGKIVDGVFMPAKEITMNTRTGAFTLTSNAGVEYNNKPRGQAGWAHLLLQQNYATEPLYHLNNKLSLMFESEFTITKCDDALDAGETRGGEHCAQVVYYLQLRNKNRDSDGYGQTIWFGLQIFDSRTAGTASGDYVNMDPGTNTLIVNPATSTIYPDNQGKSPVVGQKTKIKVDLLPLIKNAFLTAYQRGQFTKTNFDDLYIAHTNLGFEMPGCYNISVAYDSLGVFGLEDPDYVPPEPETTDEE